MTFLSQFLISCVPCLGGASLLCCYQLTGPSPRSSRSVSSLMRGVNLDSFLRTMAMAQRGSTTSNQRTPDGMRLAIDDRLGSDREELAARISRLHRLKKRNSAERASAASGARSGALGLRCFGLVVSDGVAMKRVHENPFIKSSISRCTSNAFLIFCLCHFCSYFRDILPGVSFCSGIVGIRPRQRKASPDL